MLISEKNGIRIITLETDHLDALNSEEIKKQMMSQIEGAEKIIVNLGRVSFIDSSGLGVLLTVFRHMGEADGSMVIACVQDSVKVLFKLVRLSHMIQVFDDEKDALAKV